jgi:hypothetical protein
MVETTESENLRRLATGIINGDDSITKESLEAKYGKGNVWTTEEAREVFEIESFFAPCASVRRKSDNAKGYVTFKHDPRFYFDFQER